MDQHDHFIEVTFPDSGRVVVTVKTRGELLKDYSPTERVRLSLGLAVQRDAGTHLDLQAFRRRMQDGRREVVISLDTIRARLAGRRPLRIAADAGSGGNADHSLPEGA